MRHRSRSPPFHTTVCFYACHSTGLRFGLFGSDWNLPLRFLEHWFFTAPFWFAFSRTRSFRSVLVCVTHTPPFRFTTRVRTHAFVGTYADIHLRSFSLRVFWIRHGTAPLRTPTLRHTGFFAALPAVPFHRTTAPRILPVTYTHLPHTHTLFALRLLHATGFCLPAYLFCTMDTCSLFAFLDTIYGFTPAAPHLPFAAVLARSSPLRSMLPFWFWTSLRHATYRATPHTYLFQVYGLRTAGFTFWFLDTPFWTATIFGSVRTPFTFTLRFIFATCTAVPARSRHYRITHGLHRTPRCCLPFAYHTYLSATRTPHVSPAVLPLLRLLPTFVSTLRTHHAPRCGFLLYRHSLLPFHHGCWYVLVTATLPAYFTFSPFAFVRFARRCTFLRRFSLFAHRYAVGVWFIAHAVFSGSWFRLVCRTNTTHRYRTPYVTGSSCTVCLLYTFSHLVHIRFTPAFTHAARHVCLRV